MPLHSTETVMEPAPDGFVLTQSHKCLQCGFEWQPVILDASTNLCPKCKTTLKHHSSNLKTHALPDARLPIKKEAVIEHKPGAFVLIRGHKCFRCGHEWQPVILQVAPKVCPKCKTPYWDRPPKKAKMTAMVTLAKK